MSYTNLTAAQVKTLTTAMSPTVMGLQLDALLRLADMLAGVVAAGDTSVSSDVDANTASITALNAWATALATKLNADAGVTDTDYVTDPQA